MLTVGEMEHQNGRTRNEWKDKHNRLTFSAWASYIVSDGWGKNCNICVVLSLSRGHTRGSYSLKVEKQRDTNRSRASITGLKLEDTVINRPF